MMTPANHLKGQGCTECGEIKRIKSRHLINSKDFVSSLKKVHGDTYDYSNSKYNGVDSNLSITCHIHGEFKQQYKHHLAGSGCPKCSHRISKGELSLLEFINSFGLEVQTNVRKLIAPQELDIYVPSKNIAVEFNGIYWHSEKHKETDYHAEKSRLCQEKGIRLIHVLETEWQTRRPQIERMLSRALGVSVEEKINARQCLVEEVPQAECNSFLDSNHIQGKTSAKIRLGLKTPAGDLVALMTFSKGATLRGAARINTEAPWELTRYATNAMVRGGASKLLKAAQKMIGPEKIVSFSQNDWYDGELYKKLGFIMQSVSKPDYRVYHPKTGVLPKSHWQRRNIPKRLIEIESDVSFDPDTDPRTEREIQSLVGAYRVWDSGKIKWVLK